MARYRVLSWQGIPTQVKARDPVGRPIVVPLPDWFAQEIDRVAMRDGATDAEVYLAGWEWSEEIDRNGPAPDVAREVARELAEAWGRSLDDPGDVEAGPPVG